MVFAGAGSGKTFTLREFIKVLRAGDKFSADEIVYTVFNKAVAFDARKSLNGLCLVTTVSAAACATYARWRNTKAEIFDHSGFNSFEALCDTVTLSTFMSDQFKDERTILTEEEVSYVSEKLARVVEFFAVDFMRSSKGVNVYFSSDGHPSDNFAEKPLAWLSLHDSKFATEQPWLKRFETNDFYALATKAVWAELTRSGLRTSFDAIAKHVALEGLELQVSLAAGSRGRAVRAILVDEAQDLSARASVQVELFTVHGAKGLQWPRVQLLDDFVDLAAFKVQDGKGGMTWPEFGDEINLWYVALTRATHTLVLPPKFVALVQAIRSIGSAGADMSEQSGEAAGCNLVLGSGQSKCAFDQEDVVRLRKDLYDPWLACGGEMVLEQLGK